MAGNKGKGWYAILLSKYITPSICIPKYILDAILFAKFEFSKELLVQMIGYVLGTYKRKVKKINNLKKQIKNRIMKVIFLLKILKKSLEEVLNKNEPILYILNQL